MAKRTTSAILWCREVCMPRIQTFGNEFQGSLQYVDRQGQGKGEKFRVSHWAYVQVFPDWIQRRRFVRSVRAQRVC